MICFALAAVAGFVAHREINDRGLWAGFAVFLLGCGIVSVLNG